MIPKHRISLSLLVCSLVLFGGFGTLRAADIWPIYGYFIVETHLYYSGNKFFGVKSNGKLYRFKSNKNKTIRKKVYNLPTQPDIIKHFTLKSEDDLLVAIFKKKKKIILLSFDKDAKLIYVKKFNLNFVVDLVDIRVNNKGEPLCLLYYYYRSNYVISLWSLKGISDIYRVEYPIDHIFFQWRTRTIHMLHKKDNQYHWAIRNENNRYYQLKLPTYIFNPTFFSIGRYTFLVGVDLKGTLYRFALQSNRISATKIIQNSRLGDIDQIIPIVFKRRLQFFMPSKSDYTIWRLRFNNFFRNSRVGGLQKKELFLVNKIVLFQEGKSLDILNQTKNLHTYRIPWINKGVNLYNIDWSVAPNRKPPILSISWKTKKSPRNYLYTYLLDQKKNSEPIGEASSLRNNRILFTNPKDGDYTLHLKARDIKTNQESYLYHIPIFWRYQPPEPKIVWLNETSPSTFSQGPIRFFIKNQGNAIYYAEMNQKAYHKPSRRLIIKNGVGTLNGNVKIGWYYLHIQARDPKSKKFSTVLHLPFSINPYDPFFERKHVENDSIRAEIKQLFKKLDQSKGDIKAIKKIQRRLDELNKKLFQ